MRLIDADALRDNMQWSIDHDMYDKPYDYLAEIDDAPTVNEWIPCSERLPLIEDQDVLATTTWGDITIASRCSCDDWFIHEGNSNAKTSDINAWMPLPEPYKGGEEE